MKPFIATILLALGGSVRGLSIPRDEPFPFGEIDYSQTCPAKLAGDFEFPHLIVPVNSQWPSINYGNSYNGSISITTSSIYNFDIPLASRGLTCTLWFLFPSESELAPSNYTFKGDGRVKFSRLSGFATVDTSYQNQPSVEKELGIAELKAGGQYNISNFECPAAKTIAFKIENIGSTQLEYFQRRVPA
ncbi:hypothetical protein FQN53_003684 [Emmonsiellopsis sp. PD_33]|nr:hypothetical protein FQN53_003684 [Emmonsiellopsis sp. PD_33]